MFPSTAPSPPVLPVNTGSGDHNTAAATSTSWQHWVFVYDSTEGTGNGGTRAYLNGAAVSYTGTDATFNLTDAPLIIAKAITNDTYSSGTVDDVRVYEGAFGATDASRLYTVTRPNCRADLLPPQHRCVAGVPLDVGGAGGTSVVAAFDRRLPAVSESFRTFQCKHVLVLCQNRVASHRIDDFATPDCGSISMASAGRA